MTENIVESKSFGETLKELELIVNSLESGNLELEESLTRYEKGVALISDLSTRLKEAEQKVTSLLGKLKIED